MIRLLLLIYLYLFRPVPLITAQPLHNPNYYYHHHHHHQQQQQSPFPPPPPAPTITPEIFKKNLKRQRERLHYLGLEHLKKKKFQHYQKHSEKAHVLYNAHVQSIAQRDAMKRSDPSMAESVDVYYNTLLKTHNVQKCPTMLNNFKKISLLLSLDRVNDGICDCCDGSDEVDGVCSGAAGVAAGVAGAAGAAGGCQTPNQAAAQLSEWMKDKGVSGKCTPTFLSSKSAGHGYSMRATEKIAKGDVLLRVPTSLALHSLVELSTVVDKDAPSKSNDDATKRQIFQVIFSFPTSCSFLLLFFFIIF